MTFDRNACEHGRPMFDCATCWGDIPKEPTPPTELGVIAHRMLTRARQAECNPRCSHGHGIFVCDVCWDVSELPIAGKLIEYSDTVRAISQVRIHARGVDVTPGNPKRYQWEDLA